MAKGVGGRRHISTNVESTIQQRAIGEMKNQLRALMGQEEFKQWYVSIPFNVWRSDDKLEKALADKLSEYPSDTKKAMNKVIYPRPYNARTACREYSEGDIQY